MAVQRATTGRRRWQPRIVVQLAMLVVIALLFSFSTIQIWSITGGGVSAVSAERDGAAYMRPLAALIGELVDAQSTSVRGGTVQTAAVMTAVSALDAADRSYGESLETHKRWTDLRKVIGDVLAAKATGPAAYDQYSETIALALQLVREVSDSGKLILDSQTESFYLMDTVVNQLPAVVIAAGRAADLAVLAPAGDDVAQTRIMVARHDVATATEAIAVGLAKALDASDSRTLGTNITGQLDAFRSAVDSFVPSGTRLRGLDRADAATLTTTAAAVRNAARPLSDAVLGELDALLTDRAGALLWQRTLAFGSALLSLLFLLLLAVLLVPQLRRLATGPLTDAGREPQLAPVQRNRSDTRIIDPHDLLAVEEMLQAGRPIRTAHRERDVDAG